MINTSFYKDRIILVTGHTGFKGSWLSRILVKLGAKVVGYSLNPPTNQNLYELSDIQDKIVSIIGDIRDFTNLKNVFDKYLPECVIHLAAQPLVRESYIDPKNTYETNLIGTLNICENLRLSKSVKSFLNVTTDKVYKNKDLPNYLFNEDDELNGHDPYSNSKSCSELITQSYKNSFFMDQRCAISTARAGNVIGGGDFSKDRIIPDCVRAAEKKVDVFVRNPYSVRPYQHVLEPLFIYLEIIEKQYSNHSFQGYYNIGPDEIDFITTGELASKFCNKWGDNLKWTTLPTVGSHEASFLRLNNIKIKEKFSWKPIWHIDESVLKVIEWTKVFLKNKDLVPIEMDRQINQYVNQLIK